MLFDFKHGFYPYYVTNRKDENIDSPKNKLGPIILTGIEYIQFVEHKRNNLPEFDEYLAFRNVDVEIEPFFLLINAFWFILLLYRPAYSK